MENWTLIQNDDGSDYLERVFNFPDFIKAFSFMTAVAFLAEKQGHHPDWHNVYNKVIIRLSTHDSGNRVTEKDHQLAPPSEWLVPCM